MHLVGDIHIIDMIIILLFLAGLMFGSFVNALVWRVHKQSKLTGKKDKAKYSISKGRSMCSHCDHELAPKDLIPVISWLSLGGKCRYCHKPIEDSPLVEIATAILFAVSYAFWPYGFESKGLTLFLLWLAILVGLVALAVYDLRWYLLPNRILYPLLWLAIIQVFVVSLIFGGGKASLVEAAWGVLIGGGIFYLLFQVSQGKWIGGGDVKLGVVLGLLVGGPVASMLVIFLASLLGTCIALPLMLTGKMTSKSRLPFGPLLITGAIIVYLFAAPLLDWYRHFLLIS